MKKLVLLICFLIIAVSIVYFLPGKVEEAVVNELQEQGRRIFGTEVIVTDIDIDMKNGTALIKEISIANPEIYSQPKAITLSSVLAKFDYKSGIIEEIIISRPHVFAEFIDKNLNIIDLANHAESARRDSIPTTGDAQTGPSSENSKPQGKSDKEPTIYTIKLAALERPSVSIKSNFSDEQKAFSIERLEARNLQGNSQQLADQLVKSLFNDLSRQVIAQSAISIGDDALEKLKQKAQEKLKNLLN